MRALCRILCLCTLVSLPAVAQVIGVKTYPILEPGSLFPLPSENAPMGGVSIALRDPLREPFENPAELVAGPAMLFTVPQWSGWSTESRSESARLVPDGTWRRTITTERDRASSVSTPVGVIGHVGSLSIGVIAGYQRAASGMYSSTEEVGGTSRPASDLSLGANNWSGLASAALTIPGSDVTVGGSVSYVDIRGIAGTQFLYPGARSLTTAGSILDARLGVRGSLSQRDEISAVVGRNMLEVNEHAVMERDRIVENQDRTDIWFFQGRYRVRLDEKLSVGALAVVDYKDHPKIPEYPIAAIPRDPGTTWAMQAGVGAAWSQGGATFTIEGLVEPIWSKTWVEAAEDLDLGGGRVIRKGEVEQRNNYTFLNQIVRAGMSMRTESWMMIRFGGELHRYAFDYYNRNYVNNTERTGDPQRDWVEATVTGGVKLTTPCGLSLAYDAALITGQGRLDRRSFGWFGREGDMMFPARDYLIPPNEAVTVEPVSVLTHRVTLSWKL